MASSPRQCPRCAAPLAADARFCPSCGFAASRLFTGQILDGKYEILDKIGEGGMGEVYRARHLHLDEIRIIKVTKPDAAGDGGQPRRFQEEARLATLVRHPNVAALYDFSRQPDGSFYMVWEYIDGVTLQAWLRRHGRLSVEQALDVARQVLAGLDEIHAQGIVHRDLSPDNIMLRETSGGRLQAKIIDLGIAKRVAAESLQMTGTGLFLGKLKYCSPEQAGALPAGQTLDGRTDVYSFGVVLYEMLEGKAPFEAATPEGYLGKHLHTPPPPLDVARLPRSVGPALAAVVAKALEKRRERRFTNAREFADALAQLAPTAVGETAARTTVAAGMEPSPAVRERRKLPAAALVLALALLAGGIALLVRHSSSRQRLAAPLPQKTAVAAERPSTPTAMPPEVTVGVPTPAATPAPGPRSSTPPALVGAPVPEAATNAEPAGEDRSGPAPTAAEARQAIALWKGRPNEARARRAREVARMANHFVEAHPNDPLAEEIRASLPVYLKAEATAALDHAQPLLALLYFQGYRQLDFAPVDTELERRIGKLRQASEPRAGRRRRPTPGTAPDGP